MPHSEPSKINVIVIGAGIGGLSAAIALAHKNIQVHVYERAPELREVGAGLFATPNACRVLKTWGLFEKLEAVATVPPGFYTVSYRTGDVLGMGGNTFADDHGFPQLSIYRPDWQRILYDYAVELGVEVVFDRQLETIDIAAATVSFRDGSIANADLIVGADGMRSQVRDIILQEFEQPLAPALGALCAYRALIPQDKMLADEELRKLIKPPLSRVWAGPGKMLAAFPIAQNRYYNLAFLHRETSQLATWSSPGDPAKLHDSFALFEPNIHRLIDNIEPGGCLKWGLADIPQLPSWHSRNGRIVLLGDAAHPMLPNASQGAAMAVEDAAVLAECVAALIRNGGDSEVLRMAEMYERLRKRRAERAVEVSRMNFGMLTVEDGPQQEMRDQRLRQMAGMAAKMREALSKSRPNQDMEKSYGTPEFMEWLFMKDVVQEAVEAVKT